MRRKAIYVITKATWGGAQKYVWDLMSHAPAYGFDPVLVYGEEGLLADRARDAGIPVIRLASLKRDPSLFPDLLTLKDLTHIFKQERPDIVHLNSSKAGFIGALAARRAKVPKVVFTAHGWGFNENRSRLAKAAFTFLYWLMLRRVDTVIAVSDAVADDAPWKRVHTVRNGVGPIAFLPKHEARATLRAIDPSLKEDGVWVGTVAELHRNKGLDVGIEGWKIAKPDAQWVIVGGGEEERSLKDIAPPSVHLLGFVPDAATYLSAFDLFLLPSRTEALAYVILEAGLAGVPVIASKVGGIREAVGDAPVQKLFKPEDPYARADARTNALKDPQRLERAGELLKAHVSNNFSLESMLEETFRLY